MDKKSKSDDPSEQLADELLLAAKQRGLPEKPCIVAIGFMRCYKQVLEASGLSFEPQIPVFRLFFQLLLEQLEFPHAFEPYHRKVRHPIDYYQFSLDFIRPLIELEQSRVLGISYVDQIGKQLEKGENVVFFANHQTEADPQILSILLERTHPQLAEQIIYVAGKRVVEDPLAIPFSLGCDLLCIYSKRYIDYPPEQKAAKQLHNKNTMERMSRLLQEGGKAIYVAPSGGRDRKDTQGVIIPALFDPNSVEMFYLMAKKAKTPTHFYPLALKTYDILPPPETVQIELGEERSTKKSPVSIAFGPECAMDNMHSFSSKEERREARSLPIWKTVCDLYKRLES